MELEQLCLFVNCDIFCLQSVKGEIGGKRLLERHFVGRIERRCGWCFRDIGRQKLDRRLFRFALCLEAAESLLPLNTAPVHNAEPRVVDRAFLCFS